MDTKFLKRVAFYLLSALLSLGLIFYMVYHLMNGFRSEVNTITAELSLQSSTLEADGYIFRDETVLVSQYGGALNYLVTDSAKVSKGQAVAESFNDTTVYDLRAQILSLDKKIELLENSTVGITAENSDITSINNKVNSYYHMILSGLAEGKYTYALRSSDELLTQLNKRRIITEEESLKDFKDKIGALKAERDKLTSRLSGLAESIVADNSGYFFNSTDGYETIFSSEKLDTLTVDSFYDMITQKPSAETGGSYSVGKLVTSYLWHLALPVEVSYTYSLSEGNVYKAIFPYNYNEELSLTLEKIISTTGDDRAVLIFSTGEMPKDFDYLRSQAVKIIIAENRGYRVPVSAVRIIDDIKGVYTLHGSTVVFKRINILMESDGYYIVSEKDNMPPEETMPDTSSNTNEPEEEKKSFGYLKLYDQIIISGKDLEDGMVFY